jgi:8-oxo-dGTP pyrophosphatase MutT (NUDIX family)
MFFHEINPDMTWFNTAIVLALVSLAIGYIKLTERRKKLMSKENDIPIELELEPESNTELSDKTKEALATVKDVNILKWIHTAIEKGYEGVGVIFTTKDNYVLGINGKNEAEYPGGKVELADINLLDTAKREILEETGLDLEISRLTTKYKITGGTTGYPSYVYIVEITEDEFKQLSSPDRTFSKFIKVRKVSNVDTVIDSITGEIYELRKFNRKYVIPQIEKHLIDYTP